MSNNLSFHNQTVENLKDQEKKHQFHYYQLVTPKQPMSPPSQEKKKPTLVSSPDVCPMSPVSTHVTTTSSSTCALSVSDPVLPVSPKPKKVKRRHSPPPTRRMKAPATPSCDRMMTDLPPPEMLGVHPFSFRPAAPSWLPEAMYEVHERQPVMQLVISKQEALGREVVSKNGQHKDVHVVIKKSPFLFQLMLQSNDASLLQQRSFLNSAVGAKLVYDCDESIYKNIHKDAKNPQAWEKEVDYVKTSPLQYSSHLSERNDHVTVEVRIGVLSSRLEDMLFRIRFQLLDTASNKPIPNLTVLSAPIKVVSKPEQLKKKEVRAQCRKRHSNDSIVETLQRLEKKQATQAIVLKELHKKLREERGFSFMDGSEVGFERACDMLIEILGQMTPQEREEKLGALKKSAVVKSPCLSEVARTLSTESLVMGLENIQEQRSVTFGIPLVGTGAGSVESTPLVSSSPGYTESSTIQLTEEASSKHEPDALSSIPAATATLVPQMPAQHYTHVQEEVSQDPAVLVEAATPTTPMVTVTQHNVTSHVVKSTGDQPAPDASVHAPRLSPQCTQSYGGQPGVNDSFCSSPLLATFSNHHPDPTKAEELELIPTEDAIDTKMFFENQFL